MTESCASFPHRFSWFWGARLLDRCFFSHLAWFHSQWLPLRQLLHRFSCSHPHSLPMYPQFYVWHSCLTSLNVSLPSSQFWYVPTCFTLDSLGCETVQRKAVFRGICIIHITVEQPFALEVFRHLLVKGFQRFRASFLIHDLRGFGSLLVKTRGQLISIRRWCQ